MFLHFWIGNQSSAVSFHAIWTNHEIGKTAFWLDTDLWLIQSVFSWHSGQMTRDTPVQHGSRMHTGPAQQQTFRRSLKYLRLKQT